jgi:phospholipid-binding lipoprotein MlaA
MASGCTTVPQADDEGDPLEGTNRNIYQFNDALDKNIIQPVADTYVNITPQPVRNSVSNFFDNISYINVILNDVLQGKIGQGFSDSGRFLVNSTVGILGLFDPATPLGLAEHDEDFGQTLGVWGSESGPYLVLPLLGPNTLRDSPGIVVGVVTNLLFYLNSSVTIPLGILNAINTRARASSALKLVDEAALDPYVFIREAYKQQRNALIYDGNPPAQEFSGEFDDEPLPGEDVSGETPETPTPDAEISTPVTP